MKVALVQMAVSTDKNDNTVKVEKYIVEAKTKGVDLVVLPEMFNCPYKTENFPVYAEKEKGKQWQELSRIAKENKVFLVAGSIPEIDDEGKVFNTSYVFDRNGKQVGKHRKMHLFDINIKDGQMFKESDTLSAGKEICVFDTEFGKVGVVVCYDFRFPELSRLLVEKGAKAIVVPGAFNMTTGPAHWEILFRTRALDNQVYTIGTAPARDINGCYVSYGHSMVASPWGDVIAQADEKETMIICDVFFDEVDRVRGELPLLAHRRLDVYTLSQN